MLALLAALRRNPLECWTERHFEEPVVAHRLPFGRALLVSEPGAIRRLLLDNAGAYRKDRLQRAVLSAGMGEGLLAAEGESWRVQRRIAAPVFALRSVRAFAPAMATAIRARLDRWADGPADIDVEMRRLTLEVLERTVFEGGFGRGAEEIRLAMARYFPAIGRFGVLDLLGAPAFIPRPGHLAARPARRLLEGAIDDLIAARRDAVARGEGEADDILGRLLAAADAGSGEHLTVGEVRSSILTLFAAGHETTANALTWSMYLLSRSPLWLQRVRREAGAAAGQPPNERVEVLPRTRAVIEEALRLYPPIAAISRVAMSADALAGMAVRRGDLIVVSPWVLHRHRRLWRSPEAFDPSRFLGEAREGLDRFAWMPFGAGPRTCIGAEFALQEASLALAEIARRFEFELAPAQNVRPLLEVTLKPANGMRMIVMARRPARSPANLRAWIPAGRYRPAAAPAMATRSARAPNARQN
jgi:cytochrome P450